MVSNSLPNNCLHPANLAGKNFNFRNWQKKSFFYIFFFFLFWTVSVWWSVNDFLPKSHIHVRWSHSEHQCFYLWIIKQNFKTAEKREIKEKNAIVLEELKRLLKIEFEKKKRFKSENLNIQCMYVESLLLDRKKKAILWKTKKKTNFTVNILCLCVPITWTKEKNNAKQKQRTY